MLSFTRLACIEPVVQFRLNSMCVWVCVCWGGGQGKLCIPTLNLILHTNCKAQDYKTISSGMDRSLL